MAQSQDRIIPLWAGEIPNQNASEENETIVDNDILWIENVQEPTLEVFLPVKKNATKQGVIICPGGGYQGLAYDWEGTDIAKWLNSLGIAAFVVKYRLPVSKSLTTAHEVPLMDAKRAMRIVRNNAEKWNLSQDKIGVMGFSAGGHLASTLATKYEPEENPKDAIDRLSARPDFLVLIYPVITMNEAHTHMGSRNNLIGKNPEKELAEMYSNELHVDAKTPPTFLVHSSDDEAVPVNNSILFYQALQREKVPSEMHIYPFGGHGYSLALDKGYLSTWTQSLAYWFKYISN